MMSQDKCPDRLSLLRWARIAMSSILLVALVCFAVPCFAGGLKVQQGPDLRFGQEDPAFGVPDYPAGGGSAPRKSKQTTPRVEITNFPSRHRALARTKQILLEIAYTQLVAR